MGGVAVTWKQCLIMAGRREELVVILMATYNGEKYIAPQIESICNQTYRNWELWIRDDGSTDSTLDIIGKYTKYDARIKIVADQHDSNKGACGNFSALMSLAKEDSIANYFMFCDQDDVWHTDKVVSAIRAIEECEGVVSVNTPCLHIHDLVVVNESMDVVNESFWGMEEISPEIDISLNSILNRNISPGCAMAFNRALLVEAVPVPDEALMHDWWLMLYAIFLGKISYSSFPYIYYRQHGRNELGAKKRGVVVHGIQFIGAPYKMYSKVRELHVKHVQQLTKFGERLPADDTCMSTLMRYLKVRQSNIFSRIRNAKMLSCSSRSVSLANIFIQ